MNIWFKPITTQEINAWRAGTLLEHLSIVFTDIAPDSLTATMPVDRRTLQPLGTLHGGASCVLAETLGSVAANCCIDLEQKMCVGLDINVNHIRAVRSGLVTGIAKPLHIGRSTQVWEIRIVNEENQLVAVSRLTVSVLDKKKPHQKVGF